MEVALAGTKLAKENEPEGILRDFRLQTERVIGYKRCWQIVFISQSIFFPFYNPQQNVHSETNSQPISLF